MYFPLLFNKGFLKKMQKFKKRTLNVGDAVVAVSAVIDPPSQPRPPLSRARPAHAPLPSITIASNSNSLCHKKITSSWFSYKSQHYFNQICVYVEKNPLAICCMGCELVTITGIGLPLPLWC